MTTSALERRDWFVDAAARKAKALGVPVPTEALQRQAAADLTLLDNARRAGALRVGKDAKKKAPADVAAEKQSRKAEAQAAAVGGRMRRKALPAVDRTRRGPKLSLLDQERLLKMSLRLRAIGARAGQLRAGQDLQAGFQFPALARAAAEATMNHGARRGEYAGKNATDRDRILFRQLEDICNRSDAVFGVGWWVAK